MRKGIGHFSLEFPTKYEIAIVETRNDEHIYTNVNFDAYRPSQHYFSFFGVFIDDKKDTPNVEAMLQERMRQAPYLNDYKLLELSDSEIDGRKAKVYAYSSLTVQPPYTKVPDCTFVSREVIFETDGFVWSISMDSPIFNAETDRLDFDRIIRSFRVLD